MINTWVIGGTSGIGKATVQLLKAEGGRRVFATGQDTCDVRDPFEMAAAWKSFYETFLFDESDTVEIVYCAGVNVLARIGSIREDDLHDIYDVNVLGFISLINYLREERVRNVRMVAVSSDAAVRPMRTSIAYCSSKAALNMAVMCAARELAKDGWRVNAVAPGMTSDTDMTRYIDATVPELRGWTVEQMLDYEQQQAVIKRRARPEEVAEMIKLALEAPDYVNGSIFTINGGR